MSRQDPGGARAGTAITRIVRVVVVVVAALLVVTIVRTLPLDDALGAMRSWAAGAGVPGYVGFGAAYVVLALLFVPGAVLTALAGAVFGIGPGLVVVAIATTVADAIAFLVGRYLARDAVLGLMERYPRFRAVDHAIADGGWRIVALVRLNPTLPYSASNYLFGVTAVPFVPFLVSSGIFTLPGAFAYLSLGYVGAEAVSRDGRAPFDWGVVLGGLGLTVGALAYVTVLVRRRLAELPSGPESG